MRATPRRRRHITKTQLWWITPLFRYSYSRDAYVLRVVGHYTGPVLKVTDRRRATRATAAPAVPPSHTGRQPTAKSAAPAADRPSVGKLAS